MNSPPHTHSHAHHQHSSHQVLLFALVFTLGFGIIEAIGGWWSGSLALLSDAGHMVTDASALGLALFASWIGRRAPSVRHSYGLGRAEIIAALANSLFMIALVAGIVVVAIDRLRNPAPVSANAVIIVALLGLIVNAVVAWMLSRGETSFNVRGAMLHVMGDLLGSVAALVAGIVIYFTNWTPVDPILSLVICVLMLVSAMRLLWQALHVVMEGVPYHIDLPQVGKTMAATKGVTTVHDLHIWTLSSGNIALSAHVVISDMAHWDEILVNLQKLLHDRFEIEHVTLQPEPILQAIRLPDPVVAKPNDSNVVQH